MPNGHGNEVGCISTPLRRRSNNTGSLTIYLARYFDKWSVQFYAAQTPARPGRGPSRLGDAHTREWRPMATRREFLTSLLGAGAMSLIAACGGAASQTPARPTPPAARKPAAGPPP